MHISRAFLQERSSLSQLDLKEVQIRSPSGFRNLVIPCTLNCYLCVMLLTYAYCSVAIFDVLTRSHTSPHPFILEQPQPRLQDVLPNFSPESAATILPNIDSAHVGMVAETGSLFAMSQDRFPLVAFGDSTKDRRGRFIEGSHTSQAVFSDDAIPVRNPKVNLNCRTDVISDMRCLLGVRKIEEGEWPLKRLIEAGRGVPMVEAPVPMTSDAIREDIRRNAGGRITDEAPPGLIDADDALPTRRGSTWQMVVVIIAIGIVSAWMTWKRLQTKMTKGITTLGVLNSTLEPIELDLKDVQNPDGILRLDGEQPRSATPATPLSDSSSRGPNVPRSESRAALSLDEADDSEKDVEADGDAPPTPGRRKARRGKRGKKKKVAIVTQSVDEGGKSDSLETPFGQSSPAIPPTTASPVSSAVQVGPSLTVSDSILGKVTSATSMFSSESFFRLWLSWNGCVPRLTSRPSGGGEASVTRFRDARLS